MKCNLYTLQLVVCPFPLATGRLDSLAALVEPAAPRSTDLNVPARSHPSFFDPLNSAVRHITSTHQLLLHPYYTNLFHAALQSKDTFQSHRLAIQY